MLPRPASNTSSVTIIKRCYIAIIFVVSVIQSTSAASLECAAQASISPIPSTADTACQCLAGWTGPDCKVCTADTVCGTDNVCRKALPMYKDIKGACDVGTSGFAQFLGGEGKVMLRMQMPENGPKDSKGQPLGTLQTAILAVPSPGILRPAFTCQASKCLMAKEEGTGRIGMKCTESHCVQTCDKEVDKKFCIDILIQTLANIGKKGTFDLICEADGSECTAHEAVLDAYFSGILYNSCALGECAPANAGNQTLQETMSFAFKGAAPSALYHINQALTLVGVLIVLFASISGMMLYGWSQKAVDGVGDVVHKANHSEPPPSSWDPTLSSSYRYDGGNAEDPPPPPSSASTSSYNVQGGGGKGQGGGGAAISTEKEEEKWKQSNGPDDDGSDSNNLSLLPPTTAAATTTTATKAKEGKVVELVWKGIGYTTQPPSYTSITMPTFFSSPSPSSSPPPPRRRRSGQGGDSPPPLKGREDSSMWTGFGSKRKTILEGISGVAKAGEVVGIMGPSGSGKSTLLDILSLRNKEGVISGLISLRGEAVSESNRSIVRSRMGFLDQEHRLATTLTVGEAVLMAAMLRMSPTTTLQEKQKRVADVLHALRIDYLLHSRIGGDGHRGISGGEKRRVGVAMELMSDPDVLFLDEPTSGLDSHNAEVLVDVLCDVAKARGIVMMVSIHQPKYETYARLHHVLLLHQGQVAYSGPPEGPEADDFLYRRLGFYPSSSLGHFETKDNGALRKKTSGATTTEGAGERQEVDYGELKEKRRRKGRMTGYLSQNPADLMIQALFQSTPPQLRGPRQHRDEMVEGYQSQQEQTDAEEAEMKDMENGVIAEEETTAATAAAPSSSFPPPPSTTTTFAAHRGANYFVQTAVLSQRMMRDHFRRPWLIAAHLFANIYLGVLLGLMYLGAGASTKGIAAIQNRMGIFMLEMLFLAFTSVSALPLFWLERHLYTYEVTNGYYGPAVYFTSKMLSDLIPLRVIPPLLLSAITKLLVGFRGGIYFFNYSLALVQLTCIAATVNGVIGMLAQGIMSGILTATILMLHLLLLTAIFVNFDTMKMVWLGQIRYISFFQYGYESLVSNEMAGRELTDLPVEKGTAVLAQLGFHPNNVDMNLTILFGYLALALGVAYIVLAKYVKEKR